MLISLQRSATSEIEDEEEEIDLNLIARMLRKLKQEEENEEDEDEDQASDSAKTTKGPAVDGEKLIQEALKVSLYYTEVRISNIQHLYCYI